MNPSPPRILRFLGLCVALALAACQDAGVDPLAEIVAGETLGALALGVRIPDPGSWDLPETADGGAATAMLDWRGSWDLPGVEGGLRRDPLYDKLAALFVAELGRGGVAEELARLEDGLRRARELPRTELPEHVVERLAEATDAYFDASQALGDEEIDVALAYVLRGADALREVGPEAVARTLVAEVEATFRRNSEAGTYSKRDHDRLARLLSGGRAALSEGEWVRAIRRAYYARGLLNTGA